MAGATTEAGRLEMLEAQVRGLEAQAEEDRRTLFNTARHVLEMEKCIKGMIAAEAAARSALIDLMTSDALRWQKDILPPPTEEERVAMREKVAAAFLSAQKNAFMLAKKAVSARRSGVARG